MIGQEKVGLRAMVTLGLTEIWTSDPSSCGDSVYHLSAIHSVSFKSNSSAMLIPSPMLVWQMLANILLQHWTLKNILDPVPKCCIFLDPLPKYANFLDLFLDSDIFWTLFWIWSDILAVVPENILDPILNNFWFYFWSPFWLLLCIP